MSRRFKSNHNTCISTTRRTYAGSGREVSIADQQYISWVLRLYFTLSQNTPISACKHTHPRTWRNHQRSRRNGEYPVTATSAIVSNSKPRISRLLPITSTRVADHDLGTYYSEYRNEPRHKDRSPREHNSTRKAQDAPTIQHMPGIPSYVSPNSFR